MLYQIDIFQRSFFMVVILETEKINGNPVASLFESLFRIQDKAQYLTETFEIPVARFGLWMPVLIIAVTTCDVNIPFTIFILANVSHHKFGSPNSDRKHVL